MPFKANADRRHRIPRQRFKVTNWREYDASLRGRGSLTVWFTDEAIASWKAEPRTTRGGQPTYSGLAILTALTLRAVFRLALRQTEGLIGSVMRLLGLDLAVPDHSTLSRRAATVEVPRPRASPGASPLHLLVDSTGLKLCGAGEWLHERHGTRVRRSWRKLHLGLDAGTGRIVASLLTTRWCGHLPEPEDDGGERDDGGIVALSSGNQDGDERVKQGLFRTFGAVGAGHRIGGGASFLMRPASWLGGQRSRRGRTSTA